MITMNLPARLCRTMVVITLVGSGASHADDAVVGTGAGTCSEAAIDIALGQLYPGATFPGGTLSFNCGATPITLPITSQKTLTGATVVDGGGRITLDAQNGVRHFFITGADSRIEIHGLHLVRGQAVNGHGGAISVATGTALRMIDSSIRASSATFSGGAIHLEPGAALIAEHCEFVENTAANGGAIASNSVMTISDSVFSGNLAQGGEGGAIEQWFAKLTLTDVDFTGNDARHGGALLLRGTAGNNPDNGTRATRVLFDDNSATQKGGGVALYDQAFLLGEQVRFTRNRALDGAGLHLDGVATGNGQPLDPGSVAALLDAQFIANEATGAGGAAYVFGLQPPMGGSFARLALRDARIQRNLAAEGGGIWSKGYLDLERCSFDDNGAQRGGGMALGPTYNPGSQQFFGIAQIAETSFNGNLASQFGGAIFSVDALPLLDGVNFVRNSANIGGAIMARRFIAPLGRASFIENMAAGAGGAIYLQDNGAIHFDNLSFSGNRTLLGGGYGGDIAAESTGNAGTLPTELELSHSTLLGGDADIGASLYAGGANTRITLRNNVLRGAREPSCMANAPIPSAGGNFMPTACLPNQTGDVAITAVTPLGLSALSNRLGTVQVFVPQAGSPLIDHVDCPPDHENDTRGHTAPVDGNGDAIARCDSGAVERQIDETAAFFQLLRDSFETTQQN